MPALRKDRGQSSTQLPYENTVQFNTFINVSIPKASQPLSEEALQLRPTIPAKTVRTYTHISYVFCQFHVHSLLARRIPARHCLRFPLIAETRFGRAKGYVPHSQEARRSYQSPPQCVYSLQVRSFYLSPKRGYKRGHRSRSRRAQCFKMSGTSGSHQQRISNLAASFWRSLTHAEQSAWYALAQDVKKFHQLLFPDYQFIPHPQNATEEEKHRKTNLSAQPPSTAEQDVVIEEEMSAYIFLHAGVHVDLAEVERLQRVEDSVAPKPSKKARSQRQNMQTTALPAGSTFIFTLSDPPSTTSSEQSSHPSTPCSTPLDVNAPADASATELQPQSQYTTQDLVGWNPNYSLAVCSASSSRSQLPDTSLTVQWRVYSSNRKPHHSGSACNDYQCPAFIYDHWFPFPWASDTGTVPRIFRVADGLRNEHV